MTTIERLEPGQRYCELVIYGNLVFLAGQVATSWDADVRTQTSEVLAKIDSLLALAGSGKAEILTMQVWLRDLTDYPIFNEVYDAWIDEKNKPARATVRAELIDPRLKVEIMVVAARRTKGATATELVERAEAGIDFIEPDAAVLALADDSCVFVDVRHLEERRAGGCIPGSAHIPRGMLEFAIDSGSDFHDPIFDRTRRFVFVCGSGSRGALATQLAQEMGVDAACLRGGMKAWIAASGPVISPTPDAA